MSERSSQSSYIKQVYGSTIRFEAVAKRLPVLASQKGKVLLDIGSSGSNAVKKFNQLGAQAIGIDIKYTSLDALVDSLEPSFTDPDRWNFPIARHIDPKLRGKEGKLPESEKNPLKRFLNWYGERIHDYRTWGTHAAYLRCSERVYREFLEDFNTVPRVGQYIAARAESLPLAADSVDIVYSIAALTIFVIRDRVAFMTSMSEALRVTKPGGQIVLDPWFQESGDIWTRIELENGQQLLKSLDRDGIPYKMVRSLARDGGGGTLIITNSPSSSR